MIGRKLEEMKAKRGRTLSVRGPLDFVAVIVATGFGLGFAPVAPGTFGSLLGVAIFCFFGLRPGLFFQPHLFQNTILALVVVTALAGTWAAARAERIFNRKDAGQIVIDEVCGQLITFMFVPVHLARSLDAGLGAMADDVMAGLYAALVLSFLLPLIAPWLR
jgi:phosphatidylglycerophosphatase A